ncbi:hypothetical protein [Helicobacter cinaedi]|uniref:hypothetical protein n=1 Tax=Helicobacter cinaedi TaxID=213 RepID=UPI0015F04691|nr:hypothetical protein [Helicobacter cinaedi]
MSLWFKSQILHSPTAALTLSKLLVGSLESYDLNSKILRPLVFIANLSVCCLFVISRLALQVVVIHYA